MFPSKLIVEPVPEKLALQLGYVKIYVVRKSLHGQERFPLPVQWSKEEAAHLLHEIRGLNYHLDAEGKPADLLEIIAICNRYVNQNYQQ